ncbi:hypothetical protein [Rivularia sp. UHCC 0363]|uniref:hypothetical protein n=1 Tax=Rivularia sp. UHCC 0363 TaxID=3110244 RepID=UPI002B1F72E3|nr:hypothetical protein [Rivularia sp. UHCC 0363]MEA5592885.1 hypothetical protein [Rivularia sp. UHCC 0363]
MRASSSLVTNRSRDARTTLTPHNLCGGILVVCHTNFAGYPRLRSLRESALTQTLVKIIKLKATSERDARTTMTPYNLCGEVVVHHINFDGSS